jgi:hypothetical protein
MSEQYGRKRLARLAWLLDSSIPIPGTRFSVGIDALIGLVPFLGDIAGVLFSGYILAEAARMGVGRRILFRMAFNIAVEGLAGMIPFAGDLFDAAFKANQRNVRLLDAWFEKPAAAQRSSGLFLIGLGCGILALLLAMIVLAAAAIRWIAGA